MADKLRSVNTKFWDDPFVEGLNPSEKFLFLYLLTNSLTNLLGIYEISIKRISYDTGLTQEAVRKGLEGFGMVRKVFYEENHIILLNFLKNQNLNSNMKIAVRREYESLPNSLKTKYVLNDSEWFLMVPNDSTMARKIEIEIEREIEGEAEKKPSQENPQNWKKDIELYKKNIWIEFDKITRDKKWIEEQEKLNPNLDILLTIEKSIKVFWGTEDGWKNKKKSKAEEPNWKSTFARTMDMNKVYKQKSIGFKQSPTNEPKFEKI